MEQNMSTLSLDGGPSGGPNVTGGSPSSTVSLPSAYIPSGSGSNITSSSSNQSTTTTTAVANAGSSSTGSNHQSPNDLRRKISPNHDSSGRGSAQARKELQHAAPYLLHEMPDADLLTIFSYLLEQDLCRLSLVCKIFNAIANDTLLWKRLYQSVYEYDLPLFNPEACEFVFVKPEDSEYANPWKESFRRLYRGVHVRVGYKDNKYEGRSILYFNTIRAAVDYLKRSSGDVDNPATRSGTSTISSINQSSPSSSYDESTNSDNNSKIVFVHAGHYRNEDVFITYDVVIIGAASGNVAESIVLERESVPPVVFVQGAKQPYVGHMTLKYSPEVPIPYRNSCLDILKCSPTIDHCIIRITPFLAAAVTVRGLGANPVIKHCDISGCGNVGLFVGDSAQGTYEHNEISHFGLAGILVKNVVKPIVRENHIHHGPIGIYSIIYFANNNIHDCILGDLYPQPPEFSMMAVLHNLYTLQFH